MATTTFETTELADLRDRSEKPARSGLLAQLTARFFLRHSPDEGRILARFAGQRWCDATERQLSGALADDRF